MARETTYGAAEGGGLLDEGYRRAVDLLGECATADGFLATTTERANYRRIWGRDSSILGLAGLLTGNAELIDCARRSLLTLARYQGPHGEIPSNVDPKTERISYGGTAGRVDADLWFLIACAEYWKATGDEGFLDRILEPIERVRFLLGAWEFNGRGLLYVPPTGDWADEYVHSGYVLYDQLLYLEAQRGVCDIHSHVHGGPDHALQDRVGRLTHLIRANYWFHNGDEVPEDAYHEVLFEKGRRAAPHRRGRYWMPFFSPLGYGYRFDGLANALVSLLGVAADEQSEAVDECIGGRLVDEEVMLLPAFHPPITPKDEAWDELQMTFSHTFKNAPNEYHNGGLWPMVTGFYSASLAARGKTDEAGRYLDAIHRANRLEREGRTWSFPEYLHGERHTPGGTCPQGWSAAGAVIAQGFLAGKRLFEHEGPSTATDGRR